MRSLTYADWPSYPLVFLVPQLRAKEIREEYLEPFGIPVDDAKAIALHLVGKKTPVKEMKRWITEELVPGLDVSTKYLVVADAGYYKVLTGEAKAEANLGYVKACAYGPWQVVYVPSTRAIFYDPEATRAKIAQGMEALKEHITGSYRDPGADIIRFEAYPRTEKEISDWLDKLLAMDCDLTIDIEGFSLKHHKAGIGTISFAWNQHEGIAFPVDYLELAEPRSVTVLDKKGEEKQVTIYGEQGYNKPLRKLLRRFFRKYLRKAIYHGISYDVYVLIYQLFMTDLLDTEGLLRGQEIMLRNWDCTLLISYLATNSCAGNNLSLKDQGQEFAGNYAQDEIKDIRKIPLDQLLRYNLVDTLTTWFVLEKNRPIMIQDEQREIYETLFQPAIADIIQMQLTGLPLDMKRTKEVKKALQWDHQNALARIQQTQVVQAYTYRLQEKHVEKRNSELKKKRISLSDPETLAVTYNPKSPDQTRDLLYEVLGLPVLFLTDTKQASTNRKSLKALIHHTDDPDVQDFLQAMLDFGAVDTILTTFIPAMEDAARGSDGWHYLFGSFKLGGTVSGRLSSANPNLQNLPAGGTTYGKLIMSCFAAPRGWVYVGLDFASLEDKISALTTRDPNKLKVYLEGYDGHSLRAFAYYRDQMPDIEETVESINSIQEKYPHLRQTSKTPTFALTYQGTWITIHKNGGFPEEEAKQIEARYHELYQASDKWIQEKLNQAGKDGYITAAFGLRVRTPLLEQVIRGTSKTPYEAEAEGRTAGNALGQSWCLLNTRAGVEFMGKVRQSQHRLDIKPCAHIHDAQYFLVREDVAAILYLNTHLVQAVQWQEHPDIAHDEVHLGGNLSIYWPDWSYEIEVPNHATEDDLHQALRHRLELCA